MDQTPYFICTYIMPAFAYLVGSLSSSMILANWGVIEDPATHGSKNRGATNVMRKSGKWMAAIVLLLDGLKGWFVVWVVLHHCPIILGSLTPEKLLAYSMVPICVILGHCFPIYDKNFQGGKGYATALGVILAMSPMLFAGTIAVFTIAFLAFRYVSLASLLSIAAAPILAATALPSGNLDMATTLFVVAAIIWATHQKNIKRLIEGKEPKALKKNKN
jgi:acyl phosphate:glycerol-3-phosphate acyltransferase